MHEGQLFIDDLLVVDGEVIKGTADDETHASGTNVTTSDLNLKRKRHSSELHVILSQLAVLRKQNEVLQTEFDITKNHLSKKLKYISSIMNQFAAISATLSRSLYLNLTHPSSPSHPSFPSNTGAEAKTNCAKLVRNPKALYILWKYYGMSTNLGSGVGGM